MFTPGRGRTVDCLRAWFSKAVRAFALEREVLGAQAGAIPACKGGKIANSGVGGGNGPFSGFETKVSWRGKALDRAGVGGSLLRCERQVRFGGALDVLDEGGGRRGGCGLGV